MTGDALAVRAPASSANLGAGFDVFGLALGLVAEVGDGDVPSRATSLADDHPVVRCHRAAGGEGPIWMRTDIPMARGLGFSGAARVAAIGLAQVRRDGVRALADPSRRAEMIRIAVDEEGHGDNAAASIVGGAVAYVDGRIVSLPVGSVLGSAAVVAWVPDSTVSTSSSRTTLSPTVDRSDAVHNLGRVAQLVSAFAHDDPDLLAGATDDALHQAARLPSIAGAGEALAAGVEAGAWCGWLSGSGPTVAFLVDPDLAGVVGAALPDAGHVKVLSIDVTGVAAV
ncbi:MAG: homoserine kinase [Actinomycetota bacterium]